MYLSDINQDLLMREWTPSLEEASTIYNYNGATYVLTMRKLNGRQDVDLSTVESAPSERTKDVKLEKTISTFYGLTQGVDQLNYYYNRIDLDGDQTPEVLVYLKGSTLCGSGGCSAVVLKQEVPNGDYAVVSRFTLVQPPIIVSSQVSNGWHDIIMQVSGGGSGLTAYHQLAFNGNGYPLNPSTSPLVPSGSRITGLSFFAEAVNGTFPGIPLTTF